ncbi:VOC family protein [Candidatus Microgenomates bacterium]|nr:VOC family protein [Candidatus Microgenomates bacterium]
MKSISQIIGDYQGFFSDMLFHLDNLKINVKNFPLTHICYRVATFPEYESIREQIIPLGKSFSETIFNGRPITLVILKQPLVFKEGFSVSLLELPAPKMSHRYPTGLEHAGFFVGETLPQFKRQYKTVLTGTKDRGKYSQPAFVTLKNGSVVKFYERTLLDVVNLQGVKFKSVKSYAKILS